jgi:mono/diheme cytochrome c family protein
MTTPFQDDLIDREKPDPKEGGSTRFIYVPLLLWIAIAIFGTSYLSLQTDNADLADGDKRTPLKDLASAGAAPSDPMLGATLYKKHCQACHQPTGLGVGSAFPPLAGSEWVIGDPRTASAILVRGISGEIEVAGKPYKGVMPSFAKQLKPAEMAAVLSYVRSSWGNQAAPVTTEVVESVIEQTSGRTTPWKGGAELKAQTWK